MFSGVNGIKIGARGIFFGVSGMKRGGIYELEG